MAYLFMKSEKNGLNILSGTQATAVFFEKSDVRVVSFTFWSGTQDFEFHCFQTLKVSVCAGRSKIYTGSLRSIRSWNDEKGPL
jgi:hypothetical protein